jgi:lipopolysaccharide transport system ATP-binding protein
MIRIRALSKQFRLYGRPSDRIWEWVGLGPRHRAFWALRDIDLDIPAGRTMGIVGPNGAGKSTLLKLVTGTLVPTSGSIEVEGRVAALLELGTGFHGEFTGRQNIWINGQLLGLSAEEIGKREKDIIEFSELGPFIDQPIRTYSSGMIVRLGFSVAASVDPDVLIVDEALSVGDAHFSQKCIRRIRDFREKGTTILFVSHDPGAVVSLCDEAVLLDAGEILSRGRPERILEDYTALLARRGRDNVEMTVKFVQPGDDTAAPVHRAGTFQAVVSSVRWLSSSGHPTTTLVSGEAAVLEIEVLFFAPIQDPTVGVLIRDRLGQDVFGTNTRRLQMGLGDFGAGDRLRLRASLDLDLGYGDYSLTTAIHSDETHLEHCYDWADRHYLFHVAEDRRKDFYGVARLHPRFDVERDRADPSDLARALKGVFSDLPRAFEPGAPLSPSPFLHGFHPLERDSEGRPFRWTREEAEFAAPLGGGEIHLDLAAWGHAGQGAERPVRVRLDLAGEDLGERELRGGESAGLAWPLPKESGVGLFRLRVDPVIEEASKKEKEAPVGEASSRRLGVAVRRITVRP